MEKSRRGGGSAPTLFRLERWVFLAAKQLGSEEAKCDLDAKTQSLLRFELFSEIKKILDLIKRNILISSLEGEKKFNPLTKREGSDSVITDNLINMNHSFFLDT